MMDPKRIAMQTRCVYCLGVQDPHNVIDVSYGEAGCAWCGVYSRIMNKDEYVTALTEARQRQAEAEHRARTLPRQRTTE